MAKQQMRKKDVYKITLQRHRTIFVSRHWKKMRFQFFAESIQRKEITVT